MSFIEESHYHPSKKDQDLKFVVKKDKFTAYIMLDGHGLYGHEFVRKVELIVFRKLATLNDSIITYESVLSTLCKEVGNTIGPDLSIYLDEFYSEFLNRLFIDTNDELACEKYNNTGCAMSVVIITPSRMYVANVGDSDVYLFNNKTDLIKLTTDHSGLSPTEMYRLKSYPNTEIFYVSNKSQLKQVWNSDKTLLPIDPTFDYMINEAGEPITYVCYLDRMDLRFPIIKSMCLSRSIGDYFFKTIGVISEPSISIFNKPISNEILLIGSDGFWDGWKKDDLKYTLCSDPSNIFSKSMKLNEVAFGRFVDDNSLFVIRFY